MEELPAGFNLAMHPNHMGALCDADAELGAAMYSSGVDWIDFINRSFTGNVSMNIDLHAAGLTGDTKRGSIVRWDIANEVLRQGCGGTIEHDTPIESHSYTSGGQSVLVDLGDGETAEVDLLVLADGRYSNERERALAEKSQHGFGPGMANYRLLYDEDVSFPDDLLANQTRLYNFPDASRLQPGGEYEHLSIAAGGDPDFETVCMRGHARIGIMPLRNRDGRIDRYTSYGNFAIPTSGAIPPEAKTADGLLAMFRPPVGEEPDELGAFVLDGIRRNADKIHWARMQRNPTRYRDAGGRVLLIGDCASGFFPSLGQGAGQAIEDASVAANVIRGALDAIASAEGSGQGALDVAATTSLIEALRYPRRELVADVSDQQ